VEPKGDNVIPLRDCVAKMKRQRRYRRARENWPSGQPLVHTLTKELAVFANDFITEDAGSQ
jgi:hypothetical protein